MFSLNPILARMIGYVKSPANKLSKSARTGAW
jgi:hypothetical protein